MILMAGGRFEGKVAVVTGGASGIGKATVVEFLSEGAVVVAVDRSVEGLARLEEELGSKGSLTTIAGDVTSSEDVGRMVGEVVKKHGRIDVLFNNAGILVEGTVEEVSEDDWDRIMAVNVKGPFLMSKAVVPVMLGQGGGAIVNNASCSGLVGDRGAVAYNTSKGAVVLMTKCLALDYARKGIRVNCICPGEIETPMFLQEVSRRGVPVEDYRKEMSEYHPIGRLGRPREVARTVLFLSSDESSFVTGAALSVDGGYTSQ